MVRQVDRVRVEPDGMAAAGSHLSKVGVSAVECVQYINKGTVLCEMNLKNSAKYVKSFEIFDLKEAGDCRLCCQFTSLECESSVVFKLSMLENFTGANNCFFGSHLGMSKPGN